MSQAKPRESGPSHQGECDERPVAMPPETNFVQAELAIASVPIEARSVQLAKRGMEEAGINIGNGNEQLNRQGFCDPHEH